MADQSRKYFLLFYWLLVASYSAVLFYGTANLVLDRVDGFFFWLPIVLYPVTWLSISIYRSEKFAKPLKFFLCLLLVFAAVFGVQYAYYLIKAFKTEQAGAFLTYIFSIIILKKTDS